VGSASVTRTGLVLALLSVAASVAAIAPAVEATHPTPPPRADHVDIRNLSFDAARVAVARGTVVTWTNTDETVHSVTSFPGDSMSFDLDPIGPQSVAASGANVVTLRFDAAGVFRYKCDYHSTMTGEVHVVEEFDEPPSPVSVTGEDLFAPAYVAVNWTQPVRWQNPTLEAHRILFEDEELGGPIELLPGTNVSFTAPGWESFRYRCEFHSLDFERGMVGKVHAGPHRPAFAPTTTIQSPENGRVVAGTVHVIGVAKAGFESVAVDTVEVSIGDAGIWLPVAWVDLDEETVVWDFTWNTTTSPNGAVRVHARALSEFHDEPFPTWVDVEVNNTVVASVEVPTGSSRIPAPPVGFLVLAFVVPAAIAARRNL